MPEIHFHCQSAYPHECCGALVGRFAGDDKEVVRAVPLENAEPDSPERRFVIDPRQLNALERPVRGEGLSVIGFYHSHPDSPARPSATDLEWAWPIYSYVIVSVEQGSVVDTRSYSLSDDADPKTFLEETITEHS